MCQPWERDQTSETSKCNNNNVTVLQNIVSKAIAMPALVGVAAIVYMQMFRQQYNNRNKYM